MFFRMLIKNLKQKKSMNIIILLFVILAVTFIATSISNMVAVMNGTDYFFEQSGLDDYIILTLRGDKNADTSNDENVEKFLDSNKWVDGYSIDENMYLTNKDFEIEGREEVQIDNTVILSCFKINQQKFFDSENREITSMENGTVYIPYSYMDANDLKAGDKITITDLKEFQKEFVIKGYFKDASLGAEMMGNHRCIFSEEDFAEILSDSSFAYGKMYSIKTNNLKEFKNDYNKADIYQIFSCDQNTLKLTYIMDMIVAGVLLMLSVCLIIISAVMMKFVIVFTINEEYKEIGIMKAIGIKNSDIRRMYVVKYFAIAVVGSAIGFAISIPFARLLLKKVAKNIVTIGDKSSMLIELAASIAVAVIIVLLAYGSTKKVKKLTPMDAIRSGNNGERFRKKGILKLKGSKLKPTTFMACTDVLSEIRKYVALFITGIVGIWLLAMPINTINTLNSDSIAGTFSTQSCDIWIISDEMDEWIITKDINAMEEGMVRYKNKLVEADIPVEKIFMEVMFRFQITKGDKAFNSAAFQGIHTDTTGYAYEEGTAPMYENEVALGYATAEAIDAKVGDTVYITMNGEKKEYIVSALYQTMNNLGEAIRFHQDAELDNMAINGTFGIQVSFGDGYDSDMKEQYREKAASVLINANVKSMREFINDMIGGISGQLDSLKLLILVIVILVDILVVVLMQKMFLIREKGTMGMLKTMGFTNRNVMAWQTKRIAVVLFAGMLIGCITGTPFSRITSGQIFKIMGAPHIEFEVKPFEVYFMYPLIVFIATVIICILTMLKVRKVTVHDIRGEE